LNKAFRISVVFLPAFVLFAAPVALSSYQLGLIIKTSLWALLGLSLNLLVGYMGYVSFGHAAFWGLGGYTVGVLIAHDITKSFPLVFGTVIGIAGLVSVMFGVVLLRTKVTQPALALTEILWGQSATTGIL
jgi:branched-chain amino acid transport system permease protein